MERQRDGGGGSERDATRMGAAQRARGNRARGRGVRGQGAGGGGEDPAPRGKPPLRTRKSRRGKRKSGDPRSAVAHRIRNKTHASRRKEPRERGARNGRALATEGSEPNKKTPSEQEEPKAPRQRGREGGNGGRGFRGAPQPAGATPRPAPQYSGMLASPATPRQKNKGLANMPECCIFWGARRGVSARGFSRRPRPGRGGNWGNWGPNWRGSSRAACVCRIVRLAASLPAASRLADAPEQGATPHKQ